MDPVTMAVVTAGTAMIGAVSEYQASNAQADQMKQAAAIEQRNADERAKEEAAVGQRKAGARTREAMLTQSALKATAGASGSSSSDRTVMDLWEGIEGEGMHNASMETSAASSKARGIRQQASLDRWSADSNARIKRAGAKSTLIGAIGSSVGGYSRMRAKYGGFGKTTTRAYG